MPDPQDNPSLVEDCVTLLELRDALAGDGTLNWSEAIPLTAWHGITIGGNPQRVVRVRLSSNDLTGVIPSEIGGLADLHILDLSHNSLTGNIPPQLGGLANLQHLSLQVNKLSGNIPAEFSNLKNLLNLELGQNQLTGEIPRELGSLSKLEVLLLGANYFSGKLPTELVELPNLRSLDIRSNNFTGCLPDDLKQINLRVEERRFCGDPAPIWSERSVFTNRPVLKGGVDLGVTYIERLPRYQRYQLAYFPHGDCQYPFEEFKGAVVCPSQADIKRWPDPGEPIELTAYVWNFGNWPSGPFDYEWKLNDETLDSGHHGGLESGKYSGFTLLTEWPGDESNPTVTFSVDTQNELEELIEDNNTVIDWIKGYTLGFYFSQEAYESLTRAIKAGKKFESPEHWVHGNIARMNEMFAEYGLQDRVRAELFHIAEVRTLHETHDLQWYMDGWWGIWHEDTYAGHRVDNFDLWRYPDRPDVEVALIHELMHQLGVIDLYNMQMDIRNVLLPDANRPGHMAGCGTDYWHYEWECYRLPESIDDLMSGAKSSMGPHTAGGLRSNTGHRRGFYGEYLFDTPETTVLRIVDQDGKGLPNVSLRLFQYEHKSGEGHVLDAVPEFELTTDNSGSVVLPNRGITGIVTETGHQLKPNPFGVIDVVGRNGTFLIEMEGECINYEWLTVAELNLAYWRGDTDEAVFTKKLRCPPPRGRVQ